MGKEGRTTAAGCGRIASSISPLSLRAAPVALSGGSIQLGGGGSDGLGTTRLVAERQVIRVEAGKRRPEIAQ